MADEGCPTCGALQPGTMSKPCSDDAVFVEGEGWTFPNADPYHKASFGDRAGD